MMEKVTYGAPQYMDWVAQIKAGAATVTVHFTGGALTVYGVTPAQYTTTNPFIQKAIEMSSYFKEVRITLISRVLLDTPAKTLKAKKAQKQHPSTPQDTTDEYTKQPLTATTSDVAEESTIEAENHNGSYSPTEETEHTETEITDNSLTKVEVSCLQDAQDYLQQNFSIPSYKVRSNIAAQKAAYEHGIIFVGGKFASFDNSVEETEEDE